MSDASDSASREPRDAEAAGAAEQAAAPPPTGEAPAPDPATGVESKRRDPLLRAAVRMAGATTLVLTLIAALAVNPLWSIGTLVGGALATVNLVLFIRLGEAFLAQQGRSAPWGILGALKLMGLFACVFLILRQERVSALAFVIGYGALPIGIALSSLTGAPKEAPAAKRR